MEVRLRITLIHNPTAGEGEPDAERLLDLLRTEGHSVHYRNSKDPALEQALRWPADLIVAAGGDGAVSRVLKQLPDDAPPLALLPLGTANNIARSLGIEGPFHKMIAGWPAAEIGWLDVGARHPSTARAWWWRGSGSVPSPPPCASWTTFPAPAASRSSWPERA